MASMNDRRERRMNRTRAKIFGTASRPRLAVFRSNRGMYAQLIDDEHHITIAAASNKEVAGKRTAKKELSFEMGLLLAVKAQKAGIASVVFDRRSYAYHGRVQSFAEGARKGGLKF